jgi:hypothetical protein
MVDALLKLERYGDTLYPRHTAAFRLAVFRSPTMTIELMR